jgi:hypothetical protein
VHKFLNIKKTRNASKKILLEYKGMCSCVNCGEDNDRILNIKVAIADYD